MTVLPYLTISLIAKMGRLDLHQARNMGFTALVVLLVFWVIGIALIVAVSAILPPIEGASFFSPTPPSVGADEADMLSRFIPTNVFRSLSDEYVPAVVVFCLFFGAALIMVPGKEPLLDFLDLCSAGIGRINIFLVRLAPIGLFMLTAAAAGTLRVDELERLQAYLILFALACAITALGILPLLVSSLVGIRYRDLVRAAQEPMLTAIATGKLFVVLPQVVEKCEQLVQEGDEAAESTANVVVPLAYPFPHLGKILAFVFISFAAWYVGRDLTFPQTTAMASTGALSSFASPLLTMPYLLDEYQLPQDLMPLFILPGFITTRLADVVGVMHLMALTVIVTLTLQGRLRIRWGRLVLAAGIVLLCLGVGGVASRWYLAATTLDYDLDERLLSLSLPFPHEDVVVFTSRDEVPSRPPLSGSTLQRLKVEKVLRVGYHADHLPYSFFNRHGDLVGLDVELIHRLAVRLQVQLEFVPYTYDTVVEQLESGEIDLVSGGLILNPERLLRVGFTKPYQTATIAVVLPDHRRGEFDTWDDPHMPPDLRLAVVYEDLAAAARRQLPNTEIVVIDSFRSFFDRSHEDLTGLIIAAEEGAAWNVLYPEHAVVVPKPIVQRPVGMAVRSTDLEWLRFLDGWLEFERLDGSLDRLRTYWIEGGGTKKRAPRWCVMRDVLRWLP
jgi:Na+/H+-dicarboxylate symporter/ABC-type amino acid transport substrate-binding protein